MNSATCMSEKKQVVGDQAVSAVGGAVGAGVGALAGPEGALVGGAIGSVGALLAAKYAPEYFENTIIHRYLSNRKVVAILHNKLNADFDFSFLDSQDHFDTAMTSMQSLLEAARREDQAIGSLESRLHRSFRWRLSTVEPDELTQCRSALASYCRDNGPIRICCSAICAATIAVFRSLQEQLADHGVAFELSCDAINGRVLFDALRLRCDFHFVVGPLEALVLSDPGKNLPLQIIGPVFGERQRIFVNTKKRFGFKSGIWVFSKSSAKFQYQVGLGVERNVQEQAFEDARRVPDLIESIPPGDLVIAWDPLSSVLDRRKDFAVVHQSEYAVHFILLGNRRVFRKRGFPRDEFLRLFLTEWRRGGGRRFRDGLVKLLRRDGRFMSAFARGAGHEWTVEV